MVRVTQVLEAHVLGEGDWIAASEICQLCRLDLNAVLELAALGVMSSRERGPAHVDSQVAHQPAHHAQARERCRRHLPLSGRALA